MSVSSFEDLSETLSLYLITVKSKHVNSERASQNSLKLYRSYVNNLNEIDQNDQISLLFSDNKLSLNATVFFVDQTSLLAIRLLTCSLNCVFFSHAMSCILQKYHNLTLNRIIFLSLKLSQSLLILSHYVAFILFHYYFICLQFYELMT